MNNFYKQPKILQWIEAITLLAIGLYPVLILIEKGHSNPLLYLLFLPYTPIAHFTSTPFFTLVQVYKYYSPMLLGYMANDKQIDLHSGGSFDYLFVMRKNKSGIQIRNKLLIYHLEGLINIIAQIENKKIPHTVTIIGTSYFFNDRSLKKMGFDTVRPTLFYRVNLYTNFFDLVWMYSISQGKFSIPKIWNAKKAKISGAQLIESKLVIEALYNNIRSKATA